MDHQPEDLKFSALGMRDRTLLTLDFDFPFGLNINNPTEESAIFRPLLRAIRQGAPIGKVTYLFAPANLDMDFSYPADTDVITAMNSEDHFYSLLDMRLFGAIGFMKSKRLAFFPTFRSPTLTEYLSNKKAQSSTFMIDHFSLDQDLRKWHFTEVNRKGKRRHRRGLFTISGTQIVHWFSVSIQDLRNLEPAYRQNRAEIDYL